MTRLDVHLEAHGLAGKLASDESGALSFVYAPGYGGPALSLCLPVRAETFGDLACRVFFHNLLQEGWRLDQVAARHRLDRSDTVGLLSHLGKECAGALSLVPEGAPPGKMPGNLDIDYAEISPAQLARDVADLFARRPPRQSTEFSLAGVQSKMAVVALQDGRLLEAGNGAPTTHILKVGNAADEMLVENELLLLKTAKRLGLSVVDCEMRRAGDIPYLLAPRFDRVIEGRSVRRLHQEDACQAMGLPNFMKYEKDGDLADPARIAGFANLFVLGRRTADPIGFNDAIIRLALFNFLTGNADAHAKNFALLHMGARPRLAPAYDLVCTALYPWTSQDYAMRIGGARTWNEVGRQQWLSFLEQAGARGKGRDRIIKQIFLAMAKDILAAIKVELGLLGLGSSRAVLISDCVGERLSHLNDTLGFDIPVDTDAFVVSGGGWRLSD
ncbi:MAG: type II toxin-antitoxin system HipA family toxin [Rhodospirillales bacterium]|nr:type II toxin-antitoxin system HipA family toxin [Rhodospirillales bacterium]